MTTIFRKAGFEIQAIDTYFERSIQRRLLKTLLNGILATAFGAAEKLSGRRHGRFCFTRYPVGNLISAVAHKP